MTTKWKGYERNIWERREGDKDMKRIKHKKKLVLGYLTMKIKSLQSFEKWELQTQWHSITSQKTWIVSDTMTLNFTHYRCHHHHHQYLCCCFHQLLLLFFTSIRPKLEHAPAAAHSITSRNTKKFECVQQKFVPLCCNHCLSWRF